MPEPSIAPLQKAARAEAVSEAELLPVLDAADKLIQHLTPHVLV
jgi:hypothetical protein